MLRGSAGDVTISCQSKFIFLIQNTFSPEKFVEINAGTVLLENETETKTIELFAALWDLADLHSKG